MAPVSVHVDLWSSVSTIHIRRKKCDSWDCLTSSQQAGIIISVVITSIVLMFFYMYYLGRLTTAHQEVVISQQRQRRRRRRNPTQFHTAPLVQLPVVPQYPSEHVVYTCTPFVYHSAGQATDLRGQVTRILIPEHPIPAVSPIHHPTTYVGFPVVSHVNNIQGRSNTAQPSQQPVSFPSPTPTERSLRYQPDWWQRIRRVFGLTVGRASTIATESTPDDSTIPQTRPDDVRQETTFSRPDPEHSRLNSTPRSGQEYVHNADYLSPIARDPADGQSEIRRVQSPSSSVATVHSDDFDIV
ncbi:l-aminoadipate-semialdehyde dehydrogenase large subunit [Fusarium longipes]|uniref:L-aminoadipate-semialdehyde dehydrogenase large subunit n=1 Tax=Fusarium longipes TaxID=694270 RepID=A0A395T852_9HYPO|nr:l-aminoadipate-semialdehyde dehydrogenase large subunit [Fusarium longipes]